MNDTIDTLTLTEDDECAGHALAHRPDCPMVASHRMQDRLIVTMIGIAKPIPQYVKQHTCLKGN